MCHEGKGNGWACLLHPPSAGHAQQCFADHRCLKSSSTALRTIGVDVSRGHASLADSSSYQVAHYRFNCSKWHPDDLGRQAWNQIVRFELIVFKVSLCMQGRVVGSGSFEELKARGVEFKHFELQSNEHGDSPTQLATAKSLPEQYVSSATRPSVCQASVAAHPRVQGSFQ